MELLNIANEVKDRKKPPVKVYSQPTRCRVSWYIYNIPYSQDTTKTMKSGLNVSPVKYGIAETVLLLVVPL